MSAACALRRCAIAGTLTIPCQAPRPRLSTSRGTRPRSAALPGTGYLLQVATMAVPLRTDHLLEPLGNTAKQLDCPPCHLVQKPSLESFQVPWPLAPLLPTGSRITLPSGANVILNLTFEGVAAVNA